MHEGASLAKSLLWSHQGPRNDPWCTQRTVSSSHRRSRWMSVGLGLALVAALLPGATARAQSPDVVVSQVYGGGGNSGATYRNDFIELFNRGATPVDVTGWSVQYAAAAGSTWQKTDISGTIPAGGYYLVREAAGAGGTVDLPTPDATGNIAMGAAAGKVALITNRVFLTCGATTGSCLPNPAIRTSSATEAQTTSRGPALLPR
jgi:predicted extracellular nuclease